MNHRPDNSSYLVKASAPGGAAPTEDAIKELFDDGPVLGAHNPYLAVHAQRIAFLIGKLEPHIRATAQRNSRPVRVLDIGPGHLTQAMAHYFAENVGIDTLGLNVDPVVFGDFIRDVITFDLNDSQFRDRWPAPALHDVVVMAEVLEHLHTAPSLVLDCLSTLLEPGGLFVLQTPNAAALGKRLAMVRGRNPFEPIRETIENPGHFREYTQDELALIFTSAGYQVEEVCLTNYWSSSTLATARNNGSSLGFLKARILAAVSDQVPSLRQGVTVIARKQQE
jgi:2-polyprenyl-3-methyl-5-hydroxy-6-metoxy-1,4-benzoquinol methylase